jgi:diguanylate cyclase (GGDEF)-like protein
VTHGLERLVFGEQSARAQRLRLRRFFMSAGSYALWFALVLVAYATDLLHAPPWLIWGSGAGLIATQAIFYALLRSGGNLRFEDPSMTFVQISIAVAWSLLLLAFTHELRGMMLAVLMVALLFGVFALDRRQFIQLAALAGGGYLAVVVLERFTQPGLYPDAYYVISTLVLVVALAWTALFGSYVSAVRHKLSARNDELQQALAKISMLAERDDLTGLHNRRFVMEMLERLIARAERDQEPFCICIIDLDHFKRINDRFGHAAGDQVLIAFARLVEGELRSMDFVAHNVADGVSFGRYGGEEFIMLLPATRLEGAMTAAERIRARQAAARHPSAPIVTLSAGLAEYRPGEGVESLMRRADRALYEAKYAGRNRVHQAAA